jgi:LysR family carnitine catabolism transcriptional activator
MAAMQVNIRQLRALDAIVRLGSFVEAARVLHVTPAALSLSIRELEERLGFVVLERTTRSLKITDAGLGYLPFVQRVLTELEDAERYAREMKRGHSVVRIASTQTIIATLLPIAFPEVHARWPQVRLQPLDVAGSSIREALSRRQADLAVGLALPQDDHLQAQPLFRSRWHAFFAPSHPLGARKKLAWTDLADSRLYMNKSANLKLQLLLDAELDVQDTGTASSGLAMASSGLGVGVFPGYARPFAKMMGLKCLPIDAPTLYHELEIGTAKRPATSAPLEEIQQVIIETIAARCARLQ